jgi:hypothetical protein
LTAIGRIAALRRLRQPQPLDQFTNQQRFFDRRR